MKYLFSLLLLFPLTLLAQDTTYTTKSGTTVTFTARERALKLPDHLKPVLDYPMRDIAICTGPDSTYYMTGTTDPDWWSVTGNIKIYKSKDLKKWEPVLTKPRVRSTVWNIDRDGSEWQKKINYREGQPFRPLWAPEIHYFKNTFWLTYCIPGLGNGILKSTSGKAEGPYVSPLEKDGPIGNEIDASLFQDDDGKVYFVSGNGKIMPMKDDMSGPVGPAVLAKPTNAKHVGFEGAYLFKENGKYYMVAAEFVNGDYDCFIASSEHIYGPYSERYLALPHAGHNVIFKDFNGDWWSTIFGNDNRAPFKERAGLFRVKFDKQGLISPLIQ